jgi:hypothetical protein
MGKSHSRRRIGNADQVLARRALNLAARELRLALQGLIAVGTVEFEFIRAHGLWLNKRILWGKSIEPTSQITVSCL